MDIWSFLADIFRISFLCFLLMFGFDWEKTSSLETYLRALSIEILFQIDGLKDI